MSLITNVGQKIVVSNIIAQTLPSTTLFIDSPLQLKDTILFKDPQPNPNDVLTFTGGFWQPAPGGGGGGISSINTLSASSQTLAVGTSGSDFNISSSMSTHTFNLPDAGSSSRGAVNTTSQSFAGDKTFDDNVIMGTANTQIRWAGGIQIGNVTTSALNTNSIAIGKGAKALGTSSLAFGENAVANSIYNIAIGRNSEAQNTGSVAVGYSAKALASYSTAVGFMADTHNQIRSTCLGAFSETISPRSCAVAGAYCSGDYSLAVGFGASSDANGIAIGHSASADDDTISIGGFAKTLQTKAIAIGNGSAAGSSLVANAPYANGLNTIAIGYKTISLGDSNVVIGYNGNCIASNSLSIGRNTENRLSENSINIGFGAQTKSLNGVSLNNNISIGKDARIISGSSSIPTNVNDSIALGIGAYVGNVNSAIVIGRYATSSTKTPYTNSTDTIVIGPQAQANETSSSCKNSIAIGSGANCNNVSNAIALGYNITATADGGFFVRHNTGAGNPAQFSGNELLEMISSIRFKENVEDLENVENKFELLRPVRYNPKNGFGDINTKCIGLIAEELNEIFPEFIIYENDNVTPRGICYTQMVPLLIKQIQTMQTKNIELQNTINAMKEGEQKRLQFINELLMKVDKLSTNV